MKVVIIGGVAGGATAAARLRRLDERAEIIILERTGYVSYANCGLPYYVGGVITDREELTLQTPEGFRNRFGIDVRVGQEAVELRPEQHTVTVRRLEDGSTYALHYDKLILSPGARPVRPNLPGEDDPRVFTLRTVEDTLRIRAYLDEHPVRRAVVVGGGFIGLEVAENLLARGVKVSVIDMADHILPGFDPEVQNHVENRLTDQGVMTFTGTRFEGIEGDGKVEKVLTSRRAFKADAAILSIGIRANTEFLADTGIALMPNRTVQVNAQMQTSDPDIFAVGDCACVVNALTHEPQWAPMGSAANLEGRLLARHLAGHEVAFRGVLGTGICQLPGFAAGHTGLTETQAAAAGFDAVSVVCAVDDKAHYFPGAGAMLIKLVADRATRRVLGVQALGGYAVDKVVDIVVTALYLGATIDQLADMDLAYAPPFSTAIHPLDHAVNILMNKLDGTLETFTPAEYLAGAAEGYQVLDASMQPTIEGAVYVDLATVNGPLPEFPLDAKLMLVCAKGKRAYMLQNRLKFYGYTNTRVLEGGSLFNGTSY